MTDERLRSPQVRPADGAKLGLALRRRPSHTCVWAARCAGVALYLGFMAAHAAHFTLVARYAMVTGGQGLFPGGRSMNDVGGWPTVASIYTFFAGLAFTGWATGHRRQ